MPAAHLFPHCNLVQLEIAAAPRQRQIVSRENALEAVKSICLQVIEERFNILAGDNLTLDRSVTRMKDAMVKEVRAP